VESARALARILGTASTIDRKQKILFATAFATAQKYESEMVLTMDSAKGSCDGSDVGIFESSCGCSWEGSMKGSE